MRRASSLSSKMHGAEKVEIGIVPGIGRLRVVKNDVVLLTREFTLISGGRETITARLEPPVQRKSQISNLKSQISDLNSPIPPPAVAQVREKKATEHQEASSGDSAAPPLAVAPFDEMKVKAPADATTSGANDVAQASVDETPSPAVASPDSQSPAAEKPQRQAARPRRSKR